MSNKTNKTNKTSLDNYFETQNKRLQEICMDKCKYVGDRDGCYSQCVFMNDFYECMQRKTGTGIPQCSPGFFGPEASKYGELPK